MFKLKKENERKNGQSIDDSFVEFSVTGSKEKGRRAGLCDQGIKSQAACVLRE